MDRLNPNTVQWPRVYFTGFDHRIIAYTRNKTILKRKIERDLKLLLLMKKNVICAASHLTSDFTYHFFKEIPNLLTEGIILPALRTDIATISDLFVNKKNKQNADAVSFYSEHISKTVSWDLSVNSRWFRDQFYDDFKNSESVIRKNLKVDVGSINIFLDSLENKTLLGRDLIDQYAKTLDSKNRKLLINYRELLYHISGARVVCCESSLPQENYIDYDLADLSQRRTKLTEQNIFLKLFIELFFESIFGTPYPIDFIDSLSFNDIIEIRKSLINTTFIEEYNRLINIISQSPNNFILSIEELNRIRDNIIDSFRRILNNELHYFHTKNCLVGIKPLIYQGVSLAIGIGNIFQFTNTATSNIGSITDGLSLIFNLSDNNYNINIAHGLSAKRKLVLKNIINKMDISNKTLFTDFVAFLTSVVAQSHQF